jgi:hypothetical protein
MRHLTVSVDEQTYRDARAWCAQRDTCVSHVVQAFLNDLWRLSEVRRFPLPSAPDSRSLAARYDRLELNEAQAIRLRLEGRR